MKRRNDLYITEYMLQASLQARQKKTSHHGKYILAAIIVVLLVAASIYLIAAK